MRRLLLAIALVVLLGGCVAPPFPSNGDDWSGPPGSVDGHRYDEPLAVDGTNGLTPAELEAVKARAMARVEVLRGLKYREPVELEVVSREAYREERLDGGESTSAFTNDVWRAAMVVDEDTDVGDELDGLYAEAVQGYYSDGRIVLVGDDSDGVMVDRTTLVHELVHALQDQHVGLVREGQTIDERRAEAGVIEGEANYVANLYERRCGEEWSCIGDPPAAPEADRADANVGLFLSIFTPYSEGPTFVQHRYEQAGWEGVEATFDDRPRSTAQLVHPERYPDEGPVDVTVEDRSTSRWEPYRTSDGAVRTETIGQATLFAMLWSNGAIDRPITHGASDLSPFNYSHPSTDGWVGDTLVPYRDDDGEAAHVWELAWDSAADAEAFATTYRAMLVQLNATEALEASGDHRDSTVAVVAEDDPFSGAYRVTVDGDVVTIVRAPTVDDLESVHAPAASDSLVERRLSDSQPIHGSTVSARVST